MMMMMMKMKIMMATTTMMVVVVVAVVVMMMVMIMFPTGEILVQKQQRYYSLSDEDDLVEALPRAWLWQTLTSLIELCRELLGDAVPFPGASCWDEQDLQLKKGHSAPIRTTNTLG